jgi:hypothetical protein
MSVACARIEAGEVFLPERASWLPDLEAELFAFPASRHDDQCDSISQALLDKRIPLMAMLSKTDREALLTRARRLPAGPIIGGYPGLTAGRKWRA